MDKAVCCIDLGTTRLKLAAVDATGRILAMVDGPASPLLQEGDAVQFDPEHTWLSVCDLFSRLWESGVRPEQVLGVVPTCQRATVIPVDLDGAPVAHAISWQDKRGQEAITRFTEAYGIQRFRRDTGLPPSALWTLGKLLEIRESKPAFRRDVARYLLVNDFILRRLGARSWVTDPSNASLTGLFSITDLSWSREILAAAHIDASRLPQIRPSGTSCGTVSREASRLTGLEPRTLLVLGGGDQQCAALGLGAIESWQAALSLGTAAVVSCPIDRVANDADAGAFCTVHVVPGYWVLEGIHNAFGSTLRWAANLLGVDGPTLEALGSECDQGTTGPVFLPLLAGAGTPDFDPSMKGWLAAIDLGHDRASVAHAVLAGLAMEMRRMIEAVDPEYRIEEILLAGGGARSAVFLQELADTVGRRLLKRSTSEAGIVGAAMLGWTNLGLTSSVKETCNVFLAHDERQSIEPRDVFGGEERYKTYLQHVGVARLLGRVHTEASALRTSGVESRLSSQETARIRDEAYEFAGLGLYRYKFDGTVQFIDRGAMRILGLEKRFSDPAELVGHPIGNLIIYEGPKGRLRDEVRRRGHIRDFEYDFRTLDGEHRWALHDSYAVVDERTGELAIQVIIRDITAQKKAEEERRRLESRVQQAQKLESLGVLAGGIAHDFNNLLMGILGNAGIALMDLPPESPSRASVQRVEAAALRAAELTNQLLAYSGKGRFLVMPLNVNRAIEEMAHLLETVISKKVLLRMNLAADLPTIEADASQIRQILMNLITNASDAVGDDTGVVTITTGTVEVTRDYAATALLEDIPEGTYVFVEVTDTGCGMDAITLTHIWDPFFTTKEKGRGLGLAAVLGIIRGHKGAIKVYTEVARGTTFKALFPATSQEAEPLGANRRLLANEVAWRGNGTILVADDEEAVRVVARMTLERFGFKVLLASDGLEALHLFRESSAEIVAVLLDMTMPNLGGEETFRELRRLKADVKVILSSGYTEQDAIEHFANKGISGFIQKPYRPASLIEKLRALL
jgi:PAS domain S-box-containing protein